MVLTFPSNSWYDEFVFVAKAGDNSCWKVLRYRSRAGLLSDHSILMRFSLDGEVEELTVAGTRTLIYAIVIPVTTIF